MKNDEANVKEGTDGIGQRTCVPLHSVISVSPMDADERRLSLSSPTSMCPFPKFRALLSSEPILISREVGVTVLPSSLLRFAEGVTIVQELCPSQPLLLSCVTQGPSSQSMPGYTSDDQHVHDALPLTEVTLLLS